MQKRWILVGLSAALGACNLPRAPDTTGGVDLPPNGGCPSAIVVASSDYTSTNISVLSPAGATLSESMISSASAPVGLTTALSGDVVFPSAAPTSRRLVLIDRYPNATLTWVDPETATVIGQLSVGTGFAANPQDYLETGGGKAYVSRYESNPDSGIEPNDGGSDLLILDTDAFSIVGRIALGGQNDGDYLPRPTRMLGVGNETWVSLERFNADFSSAADGRIIGISNLADAVVWGLDLPGVANCGAMALAPSGTVVAVACSGIPSDSDPIGRSAVVLVDTSEEPPVELDRLSVASDLGAPLAPALAWSDDNMLVGVAYGDIGRGRTDRVYTLDVVTGESRVLLDGGATFVLGDVLCSSGCSDLCFVADAQAVALQGWKAKAGGLEGRLEYMVDPTIGLAPRALGFL